MSLATLDVQGPIATLTLRRPDARNALSLDLLDALHARVAELRTRTDATVCVIVGEGRAFCAGMDLKAVLDDAVLARKLLHSLADLTIALRDVPQVTLAHVRGAAIGGGCGLACVCDLALTHTDAKLGFPEVDMGVCPAVVAPWLVRKIGGGRARRVLLSGGLMDGAAALAVGIADACAPDVGALDALVADTAQRLAKGGPMALRATKHLLNRLDESQPESPGMDLVRAGADLSADVLGTEQTRAMLRAKLVK